MNRPCKDLAPLINAYVDDQLPGEERQTVQDHVETCEECGKLLKELKETTAFLNNALSDPAPQMDADKVWENIAVQVRFGPSIWQRVRAWFARPLFWVPAASVTATAVLLILSLPIQQEQSRILGTKVESVYSRSGQVMLMQTAETRQPIIWILPGAEGEVDS
jgi:anti-sigma factor RsiW